MPLYVIFWQGDPEFIIKKKKTGMPQIIIMIISVNVASELSKVKI